MKCSIRNVIRGTWYVSLITYHVPRLSACPLCKENLSSGAARGYFWSILLMLAVPMVVVGVISGIVWRASRRSKS
jgi:hypothetical protein